MKKWREETQPEWPEAASGVPETVVVERGAQFFPETAGSEILTGPGVDGPDLGRRIPATLDSGRNDPDEVTVQLDDVGRRSAEEDAGPEVTDRPVFVDESGRRSRTFRRLGMAVGLACAVYAVVIVGTLLSGSSTAPWLPVPGQHKHPPAGRVDTPRLPTGSLPPSGGTGAAAVPPAVLATVSDGTTPSARARPGATHAAASPGTPRTSTAPRPTPTRSSTGAGTGPTAPVLQPPVSAPASVPADPAPSTSGTPTASASPTAGTGTVADAPASAPPVASEPAGSGPPSAPPAPSGSAPSGEHVV